MCTIRSTKYILFCTMYVVYCTLCTLIPLEPDFRYPFCGRLKPNQLGRPKANVAIKTKRRNQPQISRILLHDTRIRLPQAPKSSLHSISPLGALGTKRPYSTLGSSFRPQDLTSEWNHLPPIKTAIQDYLTLSASVASQSPGTGGHTKHWAGDADR
jgi:hypothetical protein